ncbi:MAG: S-methyl-5-thioribose-1-phosphate isomerase [Ignavibacteriae bacterium]|nr:S-methyl-5-thioribose-1-phosphate isomerase [Ignavibacteriota bacterium]
MLVKNKHYITIWIDKNNPKVVRTIDQTLLPHQFKIVSLKSSDEIIKAIRTMIVRGAPLIGVSAAYAIYLAALEAQKKCRTIYQFDRYIFKKSEEIKNTRPTAVNISFAVNESLKVLMKENTIEDKIAAALNCASLLSVQEILNCKKIGEYGLNIIGKISKSKKGKTVNILTHCNAGWLACIDYGTATAPIYFAHKKGIKLHVYVEETRPRNQGASLTAWEFLQNKIPHSIITDNAGGYVMQKGMVDMVIVGSDRTTLSGDVCNKIGTYKTALASKDNNIPFYVALPSSSIDKKIKNGLTEIPIEERNLDEVKYISGKSGKRIEKILITPLKSKAKNYGFDITPARLVTALITERGVVKPIKSEISKI